MNCLKCNASLPEGKLFCPKCGYLNDTTSGSSKFETGQSQWLQLPPNLSKQNIFAIFGGILLVIAFFLPWIEYPNSLGQLSGYKIVTENIKWQTESIIGGWEAVGNHARFSVEIIVLMIAGILLPISGGITAFLSYKKNTWAMHASLASIITAVVILIVLFNQKMKIKLLSVFDSGVFVMLAAVVLLLASIIKLGSHKKLT